MVSLRFDNLFYKQKFSLMVVSSSDPVVWVISQRNELVGYNQFFIVGTK